MRNKSVDYETKENFLLKNDQKNQIFLGQLEKRIINRGGKKRYRAIRGNEYRLLKTLDDIVVPKRGIKKAEFYLKKISKLKTSTSFGRLKRTSTNTSIGVRDQKSKKEFDIVVKRAI